MVLREEVQGSVKAFKTIAEHIVGPHNILDKEETLVV
jgi:hypothetical protein